MPNGKSPTLWIVNVISFILLTILCCTGLVNWLVLPKGFGAQGGFQLSLRHFFISFHEWTGLIFMIFITLHIALHWPYINSNLKKLATLLEAARGTPEIPIRLLGGGPTLEEHKAEAPPNAVFLGQLPGQSVAEEYRRARFLVVPSQWFVGCPLVMLEAMSHGVPVIASRIGGLPEIVDDGVTGLLFEPGNAEELAVKMRVLWHDPVACRMMGEAGRRKAEREFSESVYWERLEDVYNVAMRTTVGPIDCIPGDTNRHSCHPGRLFVLSLAQATNSPAR